MRSILQWAVLLGWMGMAPAQSPPPDASPGAFAGEWAGAGEQGSYCYLKLGADGWGRVMVDGGAGDWLAARIQWHNRQQSLVVDKVMPVPASTALRVTPLEKLTLRSGFNQSLVLIWSDRLPGCQLQRTDMAARRLERARDLAERLPNAAGRP